MAEDDIQKRFKELLKVTMFEKFKLKLWMRFQELKQSLK